MESQKRFNRRAFITLTAVISGLGLPVTGLMNHIYGMEPLTLRRHAWMSAHNSLAIVFTVAAVWHVVFNRKALFRYIRVAASDIPRFSRETIYAAAIVTIMLLIAVGHTFHVR
jgi:hypothetical protein